MYKVRIKNPGSTIKLSKKQAVKLGINTAEDEQKAEIDTRGPWGIITKFKALAIAANYSEGLITKKEVVEIYGMRTLNNPRQTGYCLEGRVSIEGKKHSAFTSSQLFEIEGELINVSIIHTRIELN